ncbi:MAG: hypothetical protein SW127_09295 [Actinomycetota bacterium]|nr:hypothetical protein [Actinomycetota bacterium]
MTTQHSDHPVQQGFAAVGAIGAAILLLVGGVLELLQGISAVAEDELFVVGPEYIYQLDLTAWGWIHIVLAIIAIAIAIGLFTGATWARVGAICIASLSIIINFLWLPYFPWWSILVIAIDLVIIWAVATWRTV